MEQDAHNVFDPIYRSITIRECIMIVWITYSTDDTSQKCGKFDDIISVVW